MIESKLFEIRDSGTFIPVIASLMRGLNAFGTQMNGDVLEIKVCDGGTPEERYLLRRAGYSESSKPLVLLCRLDACGQQGAASYDPYSWGMARTMGTAQEYICQHWGELESGEVIDVECILGETSSKKQSERVEWPELTL